MTFKTNIGNGLIAVGGAIGAKSGVLLASATNFDSLHQGYQLVGFTVPNWLGIVFYILFLVFGAVASLNQSTPVDDKFKRPYLKPFYSLVFGISITLFVIPLLYEGVTIWHLILPALFCSAIGAVVIYYVIAFFTSEKLWGMMQDQGFGVVGDLLAMFFDRLKAGFKGFFGGDK